MAEILPLCRKTLSKQPINSDEIPASYICLEMNIEESFFKYATFSNVVI